MGSFSYQDISSDHIEKPISDVKSNCFSHKINLFFDEKQFDFLYQTYSIE